MEKQGQVLEKNRDKKNRDRTKRTGTGLAITYSSNIALNRSAVIMRLCFSGLLAGLELRGNPAIQPLKPGFVPQPSLRAAPLTLTLNFCTQEIDE
ncbi:MAG: hypothetical protein CTY34_01625 [Methylobacter sp.]|nr:MAG: hypothetical protein CTY34_01625 [Methylobacter sp.]